MTPQHSTLPDLLHHHSMVTPDATAFWYKRKGIWHGMSWRDYQGKVRQCALALSQMGFVSFDRLLLVGEASPEWLIADLAAQSLGGVSVTPYPDGSDWEIIEAARLIQPKLAVVDSLDRAALLDSCGCNMAVPAIWLRAEPGNSGVSIDDLIEQGRASDDGGAGGRERTGSNDVATIAFTAGSGGMCRPIPLTHEAMVLKAQQLLVPLDNAAGVSAFCQVPFAHIAERVATQVGHLLAGGTLYFPERIDTVTVDLSDIAPRQFGALAWQWDSLAQSLITKMQDAGAVTRIGFDRLMRNQPGWGFTLAMRKAIQRHLGVAKIERLVCHGSSVNTETNRLFAAIGKPIMNAYGITEACGWSLIRTGTEGWAAIPGEAYRLTEQGELLLDSGEGILATGDLAADASGSLELIGPRNVSVVAGKKLYEIERRVASSHYISHAMITGTNPGLDIVIAINSQRVGDWARRQGHSYTTHRSLVQNPKVDAFIRAEVARLVDADLALEVRILAEPLHRSDGSITASGTLRRRAVLDRCAPPTFLSPEASHAIRG